MVYDNGIFTGLNGGTTIQITPLPTTAISTTGESSVNEVTTSPVTAFDALSVVNADASVAAWKSQRTNVSVSDITSQDCENGLSSTWSITYISDGEQAQVIYDAGAVSNMFKTELQDGILLPPTIVTSSLIDSDRACLIAMGNLTSMSEISTGPASIELSPAAQNTSVWDVIYPLSNGSYMVRLNAADGQIISGTQYSSG